MKEVDDVIDDYSGLSRTVLEYSRIVKQTVDRAKQPGFSAESWAPLAQLCAVDAFERVGNFKEVMDWKQYIDFLTGWAPTADWECSFKRITEHANVVFLELEERARMGGHESAVNSLSVYEFDAAGRIRHVDVYLQMPLPGAAMLESYEGIRISD